MRNWAIAGAFIVLALALWVATGGADPHSPPSPAQPPAQPPATNPWARDQMSILGKMTLRDGLDIYAVHLPGYPLPLTCIVVAGPQSNSIRCDDDLAGTPPAPDPSAP